MSDSKGFTVWTFLCLSLVCECLSLSLAFSLALSLAFCFSLPLSVSVSVCLSLSLFLSLSLSVSVSVSVCLSLSLSLSLSHTHSLFSSPTLSSSLSPCSSPLPLFMWSHPGDPFERSLRTLSGLFCKRALYTKGSFANSKASHVYREETCIFEPPCATFLTLISTLCGKSDVAASSLRGLMLC